MSGKLLSRLTILLLVLLIVIVPFSTGAGGEAKDRSPSKAIEPGDVNPKLQTVLQQMEQKGTDSLANAVSFAQAKSINLTDNQVTVIIEPRSGLSASIDQLELENLGVTVEATSRSLLRAKVPVQKLTEVANQVDGLRFIRLPYPVRTQKIDTTEGVALTGADSYHNAGFTGQGTQIAIIDVGFEDLSEAKSSDDLPEEVIVDEIDYTGSGIEAGSSHGTNVAEIVHDMAPDAELYLMKVGDAVDLENAKDDAIAEGVEVINHSAGWFNASYYDGTGIISDIASDARDNGVLWVNSAGNYAQQHWQGGFSGAVDDWHEFAGGDECNGLGVVYSGSRIGIYMSWNDWPGSDQDYDLYLYNSQEEEVANSDDFQNGTQPPTESLVYNVATTDNYCFKVLNRDASAKPEFEVFTLYQSPEHIVEESSVLDPAVDEKVMAVGAIYHQDWTGGPQEWFSSQGPSNSGITKPDIMGPDGVSTSGYGSFLGTSASSPHVAGAAALLLSRNKMSSGSLQNALESDAIDMGVTGKDNVYGAGRLDLSLVEELSGVEVSGPNEVRGEKDNTVEYTATAHYSDGSTRSVTNEAEWHETFEGASISGGVLEITSDLSSDELGEVEVSHTEGGVTRSDTMSVTLTGINTDSSLCFSVNSGWNLISLPGQPEDGSPTSVFDEVFQQHGKLYVWEYAGGGQWNTVENGNLASMDSFGGYYLWLPANTPIDEICTQGVKLTDDQSLDLVEAGWQLFGVPFEVQWGDDGTITLTDGIQSLNLVDAVNEGWISDKVWQLNSDGETFNTTSISEDVFLEADKGYWIYTWNDDLTMVFSGASDPDNPPTPSDTSVNPSDVKNVDSRPPRPSFHVRDDPLDSVQVNTLSRDKGVTFQVSGEGLEFVSGLEVRIFNITGRNLEILKSNGSSINWNTDDVPNGTYLYLASIRAKNGTLMQTDIGKFLVLN